MSAAIDFSKIRDGDTVLIRAEVSSGTRYHSEGADRMNVFVGEKIIGVDLSYITAVEPRPLAVGDLAKTTFGNCVVILAMSKGRAWVERTDGSTDVFGLELLVRA